ncbi:Undecaprenyl pyrophosphate synthetase [Methanothermus fervidus DSM 2088]|uniref:Tritrans,polycis-undecaprenyl-diphosphate synthase (geranylgeranyl-diphosphate specific) n=1 Tax=Methanothermus fervidus (strain ATCC 43054 / DSM 2088 / JCM 10308 / V24 S) TaxID=523846 RepID=E3GYL2_METFV|nr:polyprenyl diphosphate synthase [Methanothermus fervidus]ADP77394.1 Undecaprenyl pyrophosphate synthetase [Methanothermus fervidus DSM 2088]
MSLTKPIYKLYEWHLKRNLDKNKIPKHVAIIMDGNRRYARLIGSKDPTIGHKKGVKTLEKLLDWCIELGIKIVTVYAFSTENFKRPKHEVKKLMKLFEENFKRIKTDKKIHKNKIRVKAIGKLELLPKNLRKAIKEAEEATKHYKERLLNVAIGYDGRQEIVDAVKKIAKKVKEGKLSLNEINEEVVDKHLYTAEVEDPQLIIRTSGEERLSGFLLWQSSYSELYFCDSLWPEFRKVDFLRAIRSYQQRERRFGR